MKIINSKAPITDLEHNITTNKRKESMTKKTKKDDDKKYIPDDRICIFYVADRIYDFENIKDHKKLQKEITEFKEELLQNIGIDVMIKREAKYHK